MNMWNDHIFEYNGAAWVAATSSGSSLRILFFFIFLRLFIYFMFSFLLFKLFELLRGQQFNLFTAALLLTLFFWTFGDRTGELLLFTLTDSCWHWGTPTYPSPTSWRFQWSYGGDGEAVMQALSAWKGYSISHVYWQPRNGAEQEEDGWESDGVCEQQMVQPRPHHRQRTDL